MILNALTDTLLALLYLRFAYFHALAGWHTGQWIPLAPIVVEETLIAVLFIIRRPSPDTTRNPVAWVAAGVGTFLPLLMRPTVLNPLSDVGVGMQFVGLIGAVVSIATLGRSFGLVPANRGIQTRGVYRYCAHPMYLSHVVSLVGYNLCYWSVTNWLIAAWTVAALGVRAMCEESWLERDPEYRRYLRGDV